MVCLSMYSASWTCLLCPLQTRTWEHVSFGCGGCGGGNKNDTYRPTTISPITTIPPVTTLPSTSPSLTIPPTPPSGGRSAQWQRNEWDANSVTRSDISVEDGLLTFLPGAVGRKHVRLKKTASAPLQILARFRNDAYIAGHYIRLSKNPDHEFLDFLDTDDRGGADAFFRVLCRLDAY